MYKLAGIGGLIILFSLVMSWAMAEDITVLKADKHDSSIMEILPANKLAIIISNRSKGIGIDDVIKLYRKTAKCVTGEPIDPHNLIVTFVNKYIQAKGTQNTGVAHVRLITKESHVHVFWPYGRPTKQAVKTIKHEFIHVILFINGDNTINNIEHLDPVFTKCS